MAVSESSITVADAASGKKLDTAVVTTAAGSVHREAVFVGDPETPGNRAAVTAAGALKTDGSAVTQPVSVAALPLPSGAATAALQTQPGVDIGDVTVNNGAGAAAVNVQDGGNSITVDGTVAVSGSVAVTGPLTDTQLRATPVPVSGTVTVTANAGTNLNTSALALDATLTGGTQKAITRGGAKGATAAADMTSTAEGADHQALDVQVYHGGAAVNPTAIRALTTADAVNVGQWVGSAAPTVGQKAMASSLPVAIASDQSRVNVSADGDIDHDVANTLKNVQVAGHASPVDVPPTVVSANGDRVRAWFDRSGAQVVRRRKLRESYDVVFRLAEAAARLDQTFTQVANTNKQWATLHHTAGATKEVRLQKCVCYITAWSAASQGILELRQISAAPATGNPAITPTPHRRGGTAAEAVALYLPTTAGTEANVNSPIGHAVFDYGIMAGAPTTNPMALVQPIVLYDASAEDDEVMPPVLPVATLDGWAVMLRTVGTPAVRMTVVMKFTEEIP